MWPVHEAWHGVPNRFLKALAALYGVGVRLDVLRPRTVVRAPCPVVSIGNMVAGGAGKTPITLMLIDALRAWGFVPSVVTRGYGGEAKGPVRVDLLTHTYKEVGEEALLLAKKAPTYVARLRSSVLLCADFDKGSVLLLDDGHQHRSLHKTISFLVMNAQQGIGNGRLLPAGPLREPIAQALKRADALFFIGEEGDTVPIKTSLPVFRVASTFHCTLQKGHPVIAFSALGYPERFHTTLRQLGLSILCHHRFHDHHIYTRKDEEMLLKKARAWKGTLVTTHKDFVKLTPLMQKEVVVIDQELSLSDPCALQTFMQERLW